MEDPEPEGPDSVSFERKTNSECHHANELDEEGYERDLSDEACDVSRRVGACELFPHDEEFAEPHLAAHEERAYCRRGHYPQTAELYEARQDRLSERRRGVRQRVEIALSSLKRVFGLGETLATTLVGLATRIAAKMTAYTYAFLVNRVLGRPQGKIKDLWA